MPDFYAVLGVKRDATGQEVKAAYTSLVRRLHPDKSVAPGASHTEGSFLAVQRAWECLRDQEERRDYDKELATQEILRSRVQDVVPVGEMNYDEKEDMYSHPCRCGGQHRISSEEILDGFDATACDGCSFSIMVKAAGATVGVQPAM